MCAPLAFASLAISAATTAASYQAQSAMASAQARQNAANIANINSNLRNEYTQAGRQTYYNDTAAYQKLEQNQRQTRSAMATAAASGGESGVSGNSMAEIANEYMGNAARYASDVKFNQSAHDQEILGQMGGFQSEAQSHLNSLPVPNQPNPWLAALQIGGAGLGAYNDFKQNPQRRLNAQAANGN